MTIENAFRYAGVRPNARPRPVRNRIPKVSKVGNTAGLSQTESVFRNGLAGTALLLAATGCRGLGARGIHLSDQAVVIQLPLVEQDELYECGLASLSALCRFYEVELGQEASAELARIAGEQDGLSGAELKSALEGAGFEVFLFEGTLDHSPTGLYRHVDCRRPPLVMIATDGSNHYSLVAGYDPVLGNILLLDPRRGQLLVPADAFEKLWENARRFTLLAVPKAAPNSSG